MYAYVRGLRIPKSNFHNLNQSTCRAGQAWHHLALAWPHYWLHQLVASPAPSSQLLKSFSGLNYEKKYRNSRISWNVFSWGSEHSFETRKVRSSTVCGAEPRRLSAELSPHTGGSLVQLKGEGLKTEQEEISNHRMSISCSTHPG